MLSMAPCNCREIGGKPKRERAPLLGRLLFFLVSIIFLSCWEILQVEGVDKGFHLILLGILFSSCYSFVFNHYILINKRKKYSKVLMFCIASIFVGANEFIIFVHFLKF